MLQRAAKLFLNGALGIKIHAHLRSKHRSVREISKRWKQGPKASNINIAPSIIRLRAADNMFSSQCVYTWS